VAVTETLQSIINGLGNGSSYALLAVGVSLLFGVMHLVNFAHGELLAVAGYVTYAVMSNGLGWWVAVPIAIAAAVVASMGVEFVAFRRVRRASAFTLLLTSFAIEILSHSIWRVFVSPKTKTFDRPSWAFKKFEVGSLQIEYMDVLPIGVAVLCFLGTAWVLRSTMFGLAMRASAEDFDAARLMGVKANRVITGAFAFAGLLAGIASVLVLMRTGSASPTMGADPLLKAVIAAIIGGLGSLPGAVVGGLALGVAEVFVRKLLNDWNSDISGLTDGVVFALIAVFFVIRPQGIFNVQNAERV
jgi:branched-chain amino acid transport system permease protein